MAVEFVTIATFGIPPPAHLAIGLLREAGIDAILRNENIVAGAWDLGQASRGVEVQVPRGDAQRAHAMIEQAEFRGGVDPGPKLDDDDDDDPRTPHEREDAEIADRALRSAALGILLPPLQLYSLWLLVRLQIRLGGRAATPAIRQSRRDALMLDMVVVIEIVIIVMNVV